MFDLTVETQLGLLLLAVLLLVRSVLGPGSVAAVLHVKVVHLVLLTETLSYAHHEFVLSFLNAYGVESILQQSNFFAFCFEAVLFIGILPPLQAFLLYSKRLNQDHHSILQFLDVSLEAYYFLFRLMEQYFEFEVVIGLVLALDLAVFVGGLEVAGVVLQPRLLDAACFLLREELTAYFCFQYSIYWSLAMRSSLAASSSLLRLLNCSCTSSFDSFGWLYSRLFSISTARRCSIALSYRLRRKF